MVALSLGRRVCLASLLSAVLVRAVPAAPSARVVAVERGSVLRLEDGRLVAMANILIPPIRYPERVRRWLQREVVGKPIGLRAERADRHGRLVAQLELEGVSIQAAILRQGYAWLLTMGLAEPISSRWLAAEQEARAERRGIWADPGLGDLDAATLEAGSLRFSVVKGKAIGVARQQRFIYVNFGEDWRSDFTIRIETSELRRFRRAGIDPMALEGRTLRVRGWLFRLGGPMIEVTEPTQIEVVG